MIWTYPIGNDLTLSPVSSQKVGENYCDRWKKFNSMKTNILPNLFLIGFPKCATTTLYDILGSHPEIFMTQLKKPDYFMFKSFKAGLNEDIVESERKRLSWKLRNVAKHQMDTFDSYKKLFKGSQEYKWRGEASHYSSFPQVPLAIKTENIFPKILVSVRDPVKRFISHYDMRVRNSKTEKSFIDFFRECISLEKERLNWR